MKRGLLPDPDISLMRIISHMLPTRPRITSQCLPQCHVKILKEEKQR